jgi:methylglutaconyl-CoA hydratase
MNAAALPISNGRYTDRNGSFSKRLDHFKNRSYDLTWARGAYEIFIEHQGASPRMSESATRCECAGPIATITLNRADEKNTLSIELMDSLGQHLQWAAAEPAVRVVVLTNEGNTFCAGADLKNRGVQSPRFNLVDILSLIQNSPKPILGRIAGHCMGGGVGLAAACDISVAADDIKLGFTEVRIGVAPAIISVVCLPKMRLGDAKELLLCGERISAQRAVDCGLLNRAVERPSLDATVAGFAAKLVQGGPNALSATKQLISRVPGMERSAAYEWTAQLSAELFRSEEAAAGIAAFRAKLAPPWVRS